MDFVKWESYADRHRARVFALVGGIAGVAQAWNSRGLHSTDLINYLALARTLLSNGWNSATNSFWSPMYSWLLAIPMALHLVTSQTELLWVHVVNLGIFLFAMLCFHVFLSHTLRLAAIWVGPNYPGWARVETLWYFTACAVFLCAIFEWLPNSLSTPDLLVASFIFLSAGFLAAILCRDRSWANFLLLGQALALGYLAKAPAFPLAILFFLMLVVLSKGEKQRWLKCLTTVLAFAVIAGPFSYTLSKKENHITFGDSGRVAYLMYGDGLPFYWLAEGVPGGDTTGNYQTLCTDPPVYAYRVVPKGAFYPTLDPAAWYSGLVPRIKLRQEAQNVVAGFHTLGGMTEAESDLILAFVILLLIAGVGTGIKSVLQWWFLWLPAACGIAMFWLVHVEERFIAPFIVLGWVGLCMGTLTVACSKPKIVGKVLLGVLLVQGSRATITVAKQFLTSTKSSTSSAAKIVTDMTAAGVPPGSKILLIGNPLGPYWAWMGQYLIVGSLPSSGTPRLLGATPDVRNRAYSCMEKTGAEAALVHEDMPELLGQGWISVGEEDLYMRRLGQPAGSADPGKPASAE